MTVSRGGLMQQLLREDLATFIGKVHSTVDPSVCFIPNWHIELIAEHLSAVSHGEIDRLLINLPPRSLKSICVSVAWPAWALGHTPSTRFIVASHTLSLAIKHSLDCRLVMQSAWYAKAFPESRILSGENTKQKFVTDQRGFRFATSVGAALTGEGGDILIVDDPLNALQAQNRHALQHVNAWFDQVFTSRLNSKKTGAIVVVMQRLHSDDLAGHLLAKGGWLHLNLPAVAERETTYSFGSVCKTRSVGEVLNPGREELVHLERMRRELGSYAFAAQYQQNPRPADGTMLKAAWFQRYKTAPISSSRIIQSWDTAIKSGSDHDFSVCLTVAEAQERIYVVDVLRAKVDYPDLRYMFKASAQQWKPQAILVEDKASGQQLIQDMRRETGLPVIARTPKNDKISRFGSVCAMAEAHRIFLPLEAEWLAEFESECLMFPRAKHDDQVDALTQYVEWVYSARLQNPTFKFL